MIQWLDMKGRVITNGTTSFLQLNNVKTEVSDLEYTCRVVGKFGNQSKTVTLRVLPEIVSSSRVPVAASAAISVIAVLIILAAIVVIIIVRYITHNNSNLHYVLIIIAFLIRRKHCRKLILFSGRVKSKPFTTFMIHATPLHGGLDDESTTAEEKDEETLEMKTFGKAYKGIMSCIIVSES